MFNNFHKINSINLTDLEVCGFYCIRLQQNKVLPERYQKYLRYNRFLYIGKAQGQSLKERMYKQELKAVGHGIFFRSIGAVLGYRPKKGSLYNKKNKCNFTFSEKDTIQIIDWIINNLEVCWFEFKEDFSIEEQLIKTYLPILNWHYNPNKINELKVDREHCREIACSL